jgi:hypothetical protein
VSLRMTTTPTEDSVPPCNVVQDLVPLLHCLRSQCLEDLDYSKDASSTSSGSRSLNEEEEVEYILHQLQLPTCELESLLASAGFAYDDLELVKYIRQCTRNALQLAPEAAPHPYYPPVHHSEQHQAQQLQQGTDTDLYICTDTDTDIDTDTDSGARLLPPSRRGLEALRLEVAAQISASTAALSPADLLVATNPSSQAHKKCKLYVMQLNLLFQLAMYPLIPCVTLTFIVVYYAIAIAPAAKKSGQYNGGGGGFSMFDFDNLPDFEPLQAVLSLLGGLPYSAPPDQLGGGYGQREQQQQRKQGEEEQGEEEEEGEMTPRQRAEHKVAGLEKLLSVSDDVSWRTGEY